MNQEDLKKFFEEKERQPGPRPPLPSAPEDVAELRALMSEMDGHLNEELMLNLRTQVERVISWEDHHASE